AAEADERIMQIVQPREAGRALRVNHLTGISAPVRRDRRDPAVGDRDRPCDRVICVQGEDIAVDQSQIGRPAGAASRGIRASCASDRTGGQRSAGGGAFYDKVPPRESKRISSDSCHSTLLPLFCAKGLMPSARFILTAVTSPQQIADFLVVAIFGRALMRIAEGPAKLFVTLQIYGTATLNYQISAN